MPSVTHEPFHRLYFPVDGRLTADFSHCTVTPNQLRWRPFPIPSVVGGGKGGGGGSAAANGNGKQQHKHPQHNHPEEQDGVDFVPVSYTHLTLPTKLL
jgi:hypothetical protein